MSRNKKYEYKGVIGSLPYICNVFDRSYYAVKARLQMGWSLEDAMSVDVRKEKIYTYCGVTGNVSKLCKKFGKNINTVHSRLKLGWSIEESMNGKDKSIIYSYKGVEGNLNYLCNIFNANYKTAYKRLKCGKSIEEALGDSVCFYRKPNIGETVYLLHETYITKEEVGYVGTNEFVISNLGTRCDISFNIIRSYKGFNKTWFSSFDEACNALVKYGVETFGVESRVVDVGNNVYEAEVSNDYYLSDIKVSEKI